MGASRRLRRDIVRRNVRATIWATRAERHAAKVAAQKQATALALEAENFTVGDPAEWSEWKEYDSVLPDKPKYVPPYGTRNGERISAA